MSEFKWKKEFIAWADGLRVQYRHSAKDCHGVSKYPWEDVEDYHRWGRNDDIVEYRIYDFEVGGVYKLTFRSSNRSPVCAVFTNKGRFSWINAEDQRETLSRDSEWIEPVTPADKVL